MLPTYEDKIRPRPNRNAPKTVTTRQPNFVHNAVVKGPTMKVTLKAIEPSHAEKKERKKERKKVV